MPSASPGGRFVPAQNKNPHIEVPSTFPHHIGILPSLELLPFFEERLQAETDVGFVARSSYGSIARDMLTGALDGGILPWEIFASDVLALPGQRAQWIAPIFPHACPTELVLQAAIHRAFHPPKGATNRKPPSRLVIGVESRNSLTKNQLREWLGGIVKSPDLKPVFKSLPMDLMLQAMAADAIDGFIAPSPWGWIAEERQLGIVDQRFTPGTFAQQLVMACRKNLTTAFSPLLRDLAARLASARSKIADPVPFENAANRMALCGKPVIHVEALAAASRKHASAQPAQDLVSNVETLTRELQRLESFSALPPQIAPTAQTALLLLPT